jgi:hypothetical protein
MSETAVLPDVAPFDAIANSRELLRPMIRKARRQEGGSLISLPLCLTWLAANNSSRGLTYWWYMLIGIAVGALGTAIADVWRTHSVTQQQAAVQQAWSRAIRPLQPSDGTVAPGRPPQPGCWSRLR